MFVSSCYQELLTNIQELSDQNKLPEFVVRPQFNDDEECNVVWHKSCRSAVDKQKVVRAKREPETNEDTPRQLKTRRLS